MTTNSKSEKVSAVTATSIVASMIGTGSNGFPAPLTESEERQVASLTGLFNDLLTSDFGLDKEILENSCTARALLEVVASFRNVGWNVQLRKVRRDALTFWKVVIWF